VLEVCYPDAATFDRVEARVMVVDDDPQILLSGGLEPWPGGTKLSTIQDGSEILAESSQIC